MEATMNIDELYGQVWRSAELVDDLDQLCAFGGRFAGTVGERAARKYLKQTLSAMPNAIVSSQDFTFPTWERVRHEMTLVRPNGTETQIPVTSLVLSPDVTGLELELLDLGRGTKADFDAHWSEVRGKAVLVRHEFPFSVSHVHRRLKYGWAIEAGAAAFIIANHQPGIGIVTGSSGSGAPQDLPALGTSYEGGAVLAASCRRGTTRVRITTEAARRDQEMETIVCDFPGATDEVVVLCAHIDGHDLGQSAMDNASGVAAVLEAARRLAPKAGERRRSLRVLFFTVEEWALKGSELYLRSLSETDRHKIAVAINLDTVVGHPKLNALVSGDKTLGSWIRSNTANSGIPVEPIYGLQANSDHYNFFLNGIPSLRLIAGYEEPTSTTRLLLTPADTRDKVDTGQLRSSTMVTLGLTHAACVEEGQISPHFDPRERMAGLDRSDPWVADRT
jgi:Zn-dependent M28 family amino/carboxypeptidase